jgi:hypothetical protein
MAIKFQSATEAHAWAQAMGGALVRAHGLDASDIVPNAEKIADAALLAFRARVPEVPEATVALVEATETPKVKATK